MSSNRNAVVRYLNGTRIPMSGFKLLFRERRLWPLVLLPLILMFLICLFGFSMVIQVLPAKIALLIPSVTSMVGQFAYWLVLIIAFVFCFFAVGFLSIFITKILALPFYTLIAERSYDIASGKPIQTSSFMVWIHENIQMLRVATVKAILFFFIGLFLFAISLVPVINLIAFGGGLFLLAFDCMDYVLEIRRLGFRQRMTCLRHLAPELTGVATVLGIFLIIPGMSFILIPATVAGSAIFFSTLDLKLILQPTESSQ